MEFLVDDSLESGVKTISLVDDPAMESMFVAFDKETPRPTYVELKAYEQVVLGIALQPEKPIYRMDEIIGPYYGVFSRETIKKLVHKFHKEQQSNKMNVDHQENGYIDAYMFSDYIVDSELQIEDLKAKGIPDAQIGSWVVSYKIEDKEVFDKVLSGEFNGFSIEAFLDRAMFSQIKNELNNKVNKMKKEKKSLLEKIVALFSEEEAPELEQENLEKDKDKMARALVPEQGFEIEWDEVGAPVQQVVVGENGEETLQPLGAGEFVTEVGTVVVDDASNLVEVREVEMPEEEPSEEEPSMDEPRLPDEEVPVEDAPAEEMPEEEQPVEEAPAEEAPAEEAPAEEVRTKSIGEIVGDQDGEYYIKVVVADGVVTEAEVSSETNLLRDELAKVKAEKEEVEKKLEEPIEEPRLNSQIESKPFSEMSAYEKVIYKRRLENK